MPLVDFLKECTKLQYMIFKKYIMLNTIRSETYKQECTPLAGFAKIETETINLS